MYVADGIDDVAILGVSANFTDFTLALWFRTQTEAGDRYLFGVATAANAAYLRMRMNAGGTPNYVMLELHWAGGDYIFEWDGPSLFDGAWHLLVMRRNGDAITVRIDGAMPPNTIESALLDASAIAFNRPFALAANNLNGSASGYCECEIGQWAMWDAPVSDAYLLLLAAGESPANCSVSPVELWRCMTPTLDTPADQALGFLRGAMDQDVLLGGYHIYSKMTTAPEIGVDVPVLRLATDAVSAAIAEALLGLTANGVAHLGVSAFGLGGVQKDADGAYVVSRWSFPTDSDAHPLSVPSPVVLDAATAMANGVVQVRFHYDELLAPILAKADRFRVEFEPVDGQTPPAAAYVPATNSRDYIYRSGALADGGWRVRVYSERAGLWNTDVQSLDVTSDSTPSAETVGALEVF
jgi:Concanavalin A-like lectin/glucanases superfamily